MNEEIKTILYKGTEITVSNLGRVWWNNKERNQYPNHDGYLQVAIKTEKGWRGVGVAVLVATAFIPKPNSYETFECNHIDYNRTNNVVTNLNWLTHEENIKYSSCHHPDFTKEKNPNWGNKTLSKFYADNPQIAKQKQSRKGVQNGRCIKIQLYKNNQYIQTFNYIGECVDYLKKVEGMTTSESGIRLGIYNSTKNKVPYKQIYTFTKL